MGKIYTPSQVQLCGGARRRRRKCCRNRQKRAALCGTTAEKATPLGERSGRTMRRPQPAIVPARICPAVPEAPPPAGFFLLLKSTFRARFLRAGRGGSGGVRGPCFLFGTAKRRFIITFPSRSGTCHCWLLLHCCICYSVTVAVAVAVTPPPPPLPPHTHNSVQMRVLPFGS